MRYYNVRQLDSTDCASACLATISWWYGLELTISKLRDVCGTDIRGTNVNGLAFAAKNLTMMLNVLGFQRKIFKKKSSDSL